MSVKDSHVVFRTINSEEENPYASFQGDNYKQKNWNSINVFEMLSHQHLPVPWVWHPMGREGLEPATR
ncbi:hypothetical protein SAMN05216513_12324 [Enterococcus casseliflavus]|nr:hypothetical protein SAMN05216513_12324 [Enterococcus casseliflavus]